MINFVALIVVIFLTAATFTPSQAQTPTTALMGVVRDTSAMTVEGVSVIARNLNTGFAYRAQTSSIGRYWLRALPPGTY